MSSKLTGFVEALKRWAVCIYSKSLGRINGSMRFFISILKFGSWKVLSIIKEVSIIVSPDFVLIRVKKNESLGIHGVLFSAFRIEQTLVMLSTSSKE
jgi:hypothetical protein